MDLRCHLHFDTSVFRFRSFVRNSDIHYLAWSKRSLLRGRPKLNYFRFTLILIVLVISVVGVCAQNPSPEPAPTPVTNGISLAPARVEVEMQPGTETTLV